MDSEFQELEETLKGMRPAAPDDACLGRLLAAVEGRLQTPHVSVSGIEGKLAALRPAALPAAVSARMLETLERVPFPVDEKVVLFPGTQMAKGKAAVRRRPWYAAAAAVAVAGAFSAMMIDGPRPAGRSYVRGQAAPEDATMMPSGGNPANFVPAAVGSGLQDVTDLGGARLPRRLPGQGEAEERPRRDHRGRAAARTISAGPRKNRLKISRRKR